MIFLITTFITLISGTLIEAVLPLPRIQQRFGEGGFYSALWGGCLGGPLQVNDENEKPLFTIEARIWYPPECNNPAAKIIDAK